MVRVVGGRDGEEARPDDVPAAAAGEAEGVLCEEEEPAELTEKDIFGSPDVEMAAAGPADGEDGEEEEPAVCDDAEDPEEVD